ncbi:MAG: DNA repair protein RecN [Ignavibacteria bacterium]|nr:DNA repair protein RecN [Ignavibacteria bacterium]
MLTSLAIRNYALVDELSAHFSGGLVILTGETGGGKSIIIGALGFLLGERASATSVRNGTPKAVVEGVFAVGTHNGVSDFLRDHELDQSRELILRRELTTGGQNRCFINDTPVSLTLLREAGDLLVDIHGQHEHQSLLRTSTHIDVLDACAATHRERAAYEDALARLRQLRIDFDDAEKKASELRERNDLYRFQLQEIDEVRPDTDEDEELAAEERVIDNAEKIATEAEELSSLLYEGEPSAYDLLARAQEKLKHLSGFDPSFAPAMEEIESARAILEELARFVRDYTSRIDFSPERAEEVRDRLGRLSLLKKKYGGSIDQVLEHRERIAADLRQTETLDKELERLSEEIASQAARCGELAAVLSKKRIGAIRTIQPDVVRALKTLGMPHADFSIHHTLTEVPENDDDGSEVVVRSRKRLRLTGKGIDEIEFLVSANLGEKPRPLAKIASGGEISRVMLALKSILARKDRMPLVVFDEVDAGVSGRIAEAVGQSLKRLADGTQVIVITHLPQIAGLADEHFAVAKEEEGGRTRTVLKKLNAEERVREVARLLSGAKVTDAAMTGARELIQTVH